MFCFGLFGYMSFLPAQQALEAPEVGGSNWPRFLGPEGNNQVAVKGLPLNWSEKKNVKWKVKVPGIGFSSPVIYGNQIWLTTALDEGQIRKALCYHKSTGRLIHDVELLDINEPIEINKFNSYASPTPVIEEGRVYMTFGTEGTFCLDTKTGKVIWKRLDINIDHQVGAGSSPIIYKDTLILHFDGTDKQFVVALHKTSGKLKWQTKRSGDLSHVKAASRKSFNMPVITNIGGKECMISLGAHYIYSYDPNNGKELMSRAFKGYSIASIPIHVDKQIIFSSGYDRASYYSIKEDGSAQNWVYGKSVPKMMTGVVHKGLLYFGYASSFITCLDIKTGKLVWKQRVDGGFVSSAMVIDDKLYFFGIRGKSYVLEPGRVYKEIAVNELESGSKASVAVSGKALYLRTLDSLYRIEK
jgi:outer membrane protein assembly factor BamB